MVEIYAVEIPSGMESSRLEELAALAGPEKRKRILRYHRQEDALRSLAADLLARTVLMDKCGLAAEEIEFACSEYGKPFLRSGGSWAFNVSHAGKWAVGAFSQRAEVGIDVEEILPAAMEIVGSFFAPAEVGYLQSCPPDERLALFYDLWTLKESYVKFVGKGLSLPLDSFAMRMGTDRSISVDSALPMAAHFRQYELDPAYKLSVCSGVPDFAGQVDVVYFAELEERLGR
ncbi:4'-phosphopantetheinyl transferase family protein [Paenibacillus humicus]|uniref:4'-phosphopantetheinyl transferase family protein n=1 Tax=Paenibacillus humicus TaxID=412861 RepID=UPI000FD7E8EE|nr:4'-phosphopantetheinyl transferase superfamily protein [Paenibacillus humicus]